MKNTFNEKMKNGKKIIVLYRIKSRYNVLVNLEDGLIAALENIGYQVVEFFLDDPNDMIKKIMYLYGENLTAILGFNGVGSDVRFADGTYANDVLKAPYYGIYVDHPAYHYERLEQTFKNKAAFAVDEDFVTYIKKHYSDIKVAMLPHAVSMEKCDIEYRSRTKNIVFLGSYCDQKSILDDIDKIQDKSLIDLIYTVIYTMLENMEMTIDQAFDKIIEESGADIQGELYKSFMNVITYADKYVRSYIRSLVIKTIAESGLQIDVYGQGWEKFECSNPENLRIHNAVDYKEAKNVMKEAKIVLNVMPWFKKGSHERVFMAMMSGAVCVTDENQYINEKFKNGKNIVTYSLKRLYELPEILQNIIENDDIAEKIATEGYNEVIEHHTWDVRVREMLQIIMNQT